MLASGAKGSTLARKKRKVELPWLMLLDGKKAR
jgi:hypothetical protein